MKGVFKKTINKSEAPKLLKLPSVGRLIICTDLHGNLRDFQRIRSLFEQEMKEQGDTYLLFTGDLIHGPNCEPDDWPTYLGSFFTDQSEEVVEGFIDLQDKFPSRIHCLLGNHEHSHIGGPHTPKFWTDETLHFEQTVGAKKAKRYQKLFRTFPLVAIGRCGLAITHAAPNVDIKGPEDILGVRYEGHEHLSIHALDQMPIVGKVLWSRSCPPEIARRFLEHLSHEDFDLKIVLFGHEIVAEGVEKIGSEQLILSSSFGLHDENKSYLIVDLGKRYENTAELREGIEIKKLNCD